MKLENTELRHTQEQKGGSCWGNKRMSPWSPCPWSKKISPVSLTCLPISLQLCLLNCCSNVKDITYLTEQQSLIDSSIDCSSDSVHKLCLCPYF